MNTNNYQGVVYKLYSKVATHCLFHTIRTKHGLQDYTYINLILLFYDYTYINPWHKVHEIYLYNFHTAYIHRRNHGLSLIYSVIKQHEDKNILMFMLFSMIIVIQEHKYLNSCLGVEYKVYDYFKLLLVTLNKY